MQNFHIAANGPSGTFRFTNHRVDTALDGGVASANLTTSKGVSNPAYLGTGGVVGPASFLDRTKIRSVAGSESLNTAVQALHELGDRHGIQGILLDTGSTFAGGMMLKDKPGMYLSNSAETKAIGSTALRAVDDAARAVLQLALAK